MKPVPSSEVMDNPSLETLRPSIDYIPASECQDGKVYWGIPRSIGEISICRGTDHSGRLWFEGLRNKLGQDDLCLELHHDDDPYAGTFLPLVELGDMPDLVNKDEIMTWLLGQQIDVLAARLTHLKNLPLAEREEGYDNEFKDCRRDLLDLVKTRQVGFSHSPQIFKDMMQK